MHHNPSAFIVIAQTTRSSVSVGTISATAALAKIEELAAVDVRFVVLDTRGRERSIDELKTESAKEERRRVDGRA